MTEKIAHTIFNISLLAVGIMTATSDLPTWIRILATIAVTLYIILFLTSVIVTIKKRTKSV